MRNLCSTRHLRLPGIDRGSAPALPRASGLVAMAAAHARRRRHDLAVVLVLTPCLLVPCVTAGAMDFLSLDPGSPSVGTPDEIDAFSFIRVQEEGTGFPFVFSVDRASLGAPGSGVAAEVAVGQAAGDMFLSPDSGGNSLHWNQDMWGLIPALPAGVPAAPPIDDIDAFRIFQAAGPPLFSLVSGNTLGFSGADILDDTLALIHTAADLGLGAADDIDALQGSEGNIPLGILDPVFYFSLAPGSPSLGSEFSPADIFLSSADGSFLLYASAEHLGLLPTDNIDALLMVPEAGSGLLACLGVAAIGLASLRGRSRPGR
jgi:hypothetical protein